MQTALNRRQFCALAGGAGISVLFGNCGSPRTTFPRDGRLSARPRGDVKTSVSGRIVLDLDPERKTILQVPKNAGATPVPLFVMLHGATQNAEDMLGYLDTLPEDVGVAVLAPKSAGHTWDVVGGTFGPDVDFLDSALQRVFDTVSIDPSRIVIGGFSDGASYGLSLGLINGDFFSGVVAFSPGFVTTGVAHGRPRVFVSHGTNDRILPIDRCGRRISEGLKSRGYEVTFREFAGDHEIPSEVAREGLLFVSARH